MVRRAAGSVPEKSAVITFTPLISFASENKPSICMPAILLLSASIAESFSLISPMS